MNPIDLIGRGVSVATGAARVATIVPRFALNLVIQQIRPDEDPFAAATEVERDENGAGRASGPAHRRPQPRARPAALEPTGA